MSAIALSTRSLNFETPLRRLVATKWFWIAAAIVLLIALPNVVWQCQYHFPTLEGLLNVKLTHKNSTYHRFRFSFNKS
jgi:hypothetical protein